MTKENAKDFLPLVQAMAEGKTIQHLEKWDYGVIGCPDERWIDVDEPHFDDDIGKYRIKPEFEYTSFDSIEELIDCWNREKFNGNPPYNTNLEMPLIWIRPKGGKMSSFITDYDYSTDIVFIGYVELNLSDLFDGYTFLDGSPIGKVKE